MEGGGGGGSGGREGGALLDDVALASHAAASQIRTQHEGFVRKRGQINTAFKERYFVLSHGRLRYYKRKAPASDMPTYMFEQCTSPKGELLCSGLTAAAYSAGTAAGATSPLDARASSFRSNSLNGCEIPKDAAALQGDAITDPVPAQEGKTVHAHEWQHVIEVACATYGRSYYLKASSAEECSSWLHAIKGARRTALAKLEMRLSTFLRVKRKVAFLYDHSVTQVSIGVLLLMNFLISIVQLEMEASRDFSEYEETFTQVNYAFTVIYTIELAINIFGHCPNSAGQWWPFFASSWQNP